VEAEATLEGARLKAAADPKAAEKTLEEARASAKRATELDPKLGAAWINAGTIAAKQKRYADARAAFQRASALDPTDPRPKANLEELEALEAAH